MNKNQNDQTTTMEMTAMEIAMAKAVAKVAARTTGTTDIAVAISEVVPAGFYYDNSAFGHRPLAKVAKSVVKSYRSGESQTPQDLSNFAPKYKEATSFLVKQGAITNAEALVIMERIENAADPENDEATVAYIMGLAYNAIPKEPKFTKENCGSQVVAEFFAEFFDDVVNASDENMASICDRAEVALIDDGYTKEQASDITAMFRNCSTFDEALEMLVSIRVSDEELCVEMITTPEEFVNLIHTYFKKSTIITKQFVIESKSEPVKDSEGNVKTDGDGKTMFRTKTSVAETLTTTDLSKYEVNERGECILGLVEWKGISVDANQPYSPNTFTIVGRDFSTMVGHKSGIFRKEGNKPGEYSVWARCKGKANHFYKITSPGEIETWTPKYASSIECYGVPEGPSGLKGSTIRYWAQNSIPDAYLTDPEVVKHHAALIAANGPTKDTMKTGLRLAQMVTAQPCTGMLESYAYPVFTKTENDHVKGQPATLPGPTTPGGKADGLAVMREHAMRQVINQRLELLDINVQVDGGILGCYSQSRPATCKTQTKYSGFAVVQDLINQVNNCDGIEWKCVGCSNVDDAQIFLDDNTMKTGEFSLVDEEGSLCVEMNWMKGSKFAKLYDTINVGIQLLNKIINNSNVNDFAEFFKDSMDALAFSAMTSTSDVLGLIGVLNAPVMEEARRKLDQGESIESVRAWAIENSAASKNYYSNRLVGKQLTDLIAKMLNQFSVPSQGNNLVIQPLVRNIGDVDTSTGARICYSPLYNTILTKLNARDKKLAKGKKLTPKTIKICDELETKFKIIRKGEYYRLLAVLIKYPTQGAEEYVIGEFICIAEYEELLRKYNSTGNFDQIDESLIDGIMEEVKATSTSVIHVTDDDDYKAMIAGFDFDIDAFQVSTSPFIVENFIEARDSLVDENGNARAQRVTNSEPLKASNSKSLFDFLTGKGIDPSKFLYELIVKNNNN